MINKDWHLAHPMPKNATLEQRVKWHVAHLEACGCRTDLPPAIAAEIAKRGLKPKGASMSAVKTTAKTAPKTAARVSPRNGLWPAASSYRITPREKRSDRPSTGRPKTCSGDI